MPYDEKTAVRVRKLFDARADTVELKMFGGAAFIVRGHMCCGVLDHTLIVRVGPDAYDAALKRSHAREMTFTGKPLTGFVVVDPAGFKDARGLKAWIQRGLDYVEAQPPKAPKKKKTRPAPRLTSNAKVRRRA